MSDKKYQRFGKYLILDHLVDGGMAKICRANYLGEQANKIVAIKMIQPQYSSNPSFVQMFEDELKVTFGLLHPNIAQVYDYGMVDNQLYTAMEYVDGANLKQFLDRLKQKKYVFPVEISTYIISQVCQALHYAHTFQDKLTGKSFNIIHRDISPHNIMLTYDGSVKVIDFGIAKADSNSEATQAGTIKGKLSYLAPEYLEGLELDHRYDQFAIGITLWEMLCSRKLFIAKNDLAVLKLIQACKVPKPSSINPNVPPELDDIVMQALAKDRNQRFENLDKLNRALVKFLYSNYPEFNATDLSYFAKQLFKAEIANDKKKFVEFGKINLKPFIEDFKGSENNGNADGVGSSGGSIGSEDGSFISGANRTGKIELDLGSFDSESPTSQNLDLDLTFSEKTAIGIKRKTVTQTNRKIKRAVENKQDKTSRTRIVSNKTTKTKVNYNKTKNKTNSNIKTSSGSSLIPTLAIAGCLVLAIFKPDLVHEYTGIQLPGISQDKKNSTIDTDPGREPKGVQDVKDSDFNNGRIVLDDLSMDMKVFLNGREVDITGLGIKINLNTDYELVIKQQAHKSWTYPENIRLTEEKSALKISIPRLERLTTGLLSSSDNFTPGSKIIFEIDGEKVEKPLPLRNERVPAGTYDGVIKNVVLGTERSIRFTVEENKKNMIK